MSKKKKKKKRNVVGSLRKSDICIYCLYLQCESYQFECLILLCSEQHIFALTGCCFIPYLWRVILREWKNSNFSFATHTHTHTVFWIRKYRAATTVAAGNDPIDQTSDDNSRASPGNCFDFKGEFELRAFSIVNNIAQFSSWVIFRNVCLYPGSRVVNPGRGRFFIDFWKTCS